MEYKIKLRIDSKSYITDKINSFLIITFLIGFLICFVNAELGGAIFMVSICLIFTISSLIVPYDGKVCTIAIDDYGNTALQINGIGIIRFNLIQGYNEKDIKIKVSGLKQNLHMRLKTDSGLMYLYGNSKLGNYCERIFTNHGINIKRKY